MSSNELKYGAIFFTGGNHKGKLGYYDDDEDNGIALVFLGKPFQSEYVRVPYTDIRNITSLEHEKFKRENPEFSKALGID